MQLLFFLDVDAEIFVNQMPLSKNTIVDVTGRQTDCFVHDFDPAVRRPAEVSDCVFRVCSHLSARCDLPLFDFYFVVFHFAF